MWDVVNLTHDPDHSYDSPVVNDNGWVVWVGNDGHDYEIYLRKPGGATIQLTDNEFDDIQLTIDNANTIAWSGHDGNDWEIYLKFEDDISAGRETWNDVDDVSPQIGDKASFGSIFWLSNDDGDNWHVYGNEWQCPDIRRLTDSELNEEQLESSEDGSIVWVGTTPNPSLCPSCTDDEIYRYSKSSGCSAGSGVINVSNRPGAIDIHPHINGKGSVVWEGVDSQNEIFYYDDTHGKVQVTDDSVEDMNPQINDNDWLVWTRGLGSDQKIFFGDAYRAGARPWYDNVGGANWVLVCNPPGAAGQVKYKIKLDNGLLESGILEPGELVTPTFSGEIGGPLEVTSTGGDVIASQRSIWGPSFGETAGYPYTGLTSNYYWTWYDQQSPGMVNWILLANLDQSASAKYEILVAGNLEREGTLPPGGQVTPTIPGTIGGPVEVRTSGGKVIASQRVLYNGYFNEVMGATFN